MNNRELLEYAAKAVGYVINDYVGYDSDVAWVYPVGSLKNDDGKFPEFKWTPITNDGVALRLAVKFQISVEQCPDSGDGEGSYCLTGDCIFEYHKNDPESATRRAIVRAVAEIGKAMESN